MLRTRSSLYSVHRAAVRFGRPCTPAFEAAFLRAHVRDGRGQGLLDLRAAATALSKAGEHRSAVRIYRKSLAFDPEAPDLYFQLGEACFHAGLDLLATRYLTRGRRLDLRKQYDFDFVLGRVHFRLGRLERARRAFKRTLARAPQAATWVNLGVTYEGMGLLRRARTCYRRALGLESEGDTAATARRLLCELILRPKPPAPAAAMEPAPALPAAAPAEPGDGRAGDRKSTRLNS